MQVCACVGLVLSIQQYTVYMCKCNVRMYVCWNQACVVTYLCVHMYCRLSFLASVVNLCSMYLLDLSDKTRQEYCHFCTRYVCTTYDMVVGGTVHSMVVGGTMYDMVVGGTVHSMVVGGTMYDMVVGGTVHSMVVGGTVHSMVVGGTVHSMGVPACV